MWPTVRSPWKLKLQHSVVSILYVAWRLILSTTIVRCFCIVLTGPKQDQTIAFRRGYDTLSPNSSCNESVFSDMDLSQRSRPISTANLFHSESSESAGLSDSNCTRNKEQPTLASVLSASSKPSQLQNGSKHLGNKYVLTKKLLTRYELIRIFATGPVAEKKTHTSGFVVSANEINQWSRVSFFKSSPISNPRKTSLGTWNTRTPA